MPQHRGKSQTDILIGQGGGSAAEHTEFEFFATYSSTATFEYINLAAGTDRQSSAYELVLRDATGGPIATFAARYKAWVDRGTAPGTKKVIDTQNEFTPAPDGSSPSWPLSARTSADRSWKVDTFDANGSLFARQWASWQVRSTFANTTGTVIQTVTDQTSDLLRIQLVYMEGKYTLLTVVTTMYADSVLKGVTADPPDVTDRFTP